MKFYRANFGLRPGVSGSVSDSVFPIHEIPNLYGCYIIYDKQMKDKRGVKDTIRLQIRESIIRSYGCCMVASRTWGYSYQIIT